MVCRQMAQASMRRHAMGWRIVPRSMAGFSRSNSRPKPRQPTNRRHLQQSRRGTMLLLAFPTDTLRLVPILIAVLFLAALPQQAAAAEHSAEVEGTEFKVTLPDGRVLGSALLVGATLTISTGGGSARLHIDAVERDPDARNPPVWLHTFSIEAADGTSQNVCEA